MIEEWRPGHFTKPDLRVTNHVATSATLWERMESNHYCRVLKDWKNVRCSPELLSRLWYCESQNISCIAIPFTVLFVVWLFKAYLALLNKTVKPFLSSDNLHSLSLAEHNAVAVKTTADYVQLIFSI